MTKPRIDKRHDGLFKQSFSDVDVARAALIDALPKKLLKRLDMSTLRPVNASFIDDEFKQSHSDIVYEVNTRDGGIAYLCLIEHQSSVDEFMIIRFIEYICKAIRHHLKQGNKHYPIVVPLLIYNGTVSPYPNSTDFFDYFQDKKLAKAVMLRPFSLVDLSVTPDEKLLENPLTAYPYLLLKYMQAKRDWLPVFEKICQVHLIQKLLEQGKGQLLENLVYLTLCEAELRSKQQFIDAVKIQSQELGDKAMTLLQAERQAGEQAGLQKGIQQGRQEGIQQGEQHKQYEIAKNMLREGADDNFVTKTTGLGLGIVAKLKTEIKH